MHSNELNMQLKLSLRFVSIFTAPFDSGQVTGFFNSGNGRSFGMNASPEMALSPSISSVATSASEVSFFWLLILYYSEREVNRFFDQKVQWALGLLEKNLYFPHITGFSLSPLK